MVAVRSSALSFQRGAVKGVWRLWLSLLAFLLSSQVVAQGVNFDGVLGDIPATICNAATFLAGPVGFAIVAVVFIIGLIRILAGNRGGLGFVITAFVIGLVLVAAPEILGTFTGTSCV